MKTPVAILLHVPQQPIFGGKREDAIIAYTFDEYLKTSDPEWPLLLPMVKSAVRGMDAVTEFSDQTWSLKLKSFTVTGGSKRGWTTWLTGAIDGRTNVFSLERWNELSYRYAPYTELFNITGQPAISLPLAEAGVVGLPIGVQLVAPLGHDARLLNLAAWLEREQPWAGRLAALRQRLMAQAAASA